MGQYTAQDIKTIRDVMGWSQQRLAEELGYSRRQIIRWEKSETPFFVSDWSYWNSSKKGERLKNLLIQVKAKLAKQKTVTKKKRIKKRASKK